MKRPSNLKGETRRGGKRIERDQSYYLPLTSIALFFLLSVFLEPLARFFLLLFLLSRVAEHLLDALMLH